MQQTDAMIAQVRQILEGYLPNLIGGLVILAIGLVVALAVSALISVILRRLMVDKRLAQWAFGSDSGKPVKAERWISRLVFFLVVLFVLVAFFQTLGLTQLTEPLNQILGTLSNYAPRIIGAAVLFLLAWILASAIRFLVTRVLSTAGLDRWLRDLFGSTKARVSLVDNLAATAYWLVFLLFVPALLEVLALQGLLGPVQGMFGQVLTFLPNLVAAGLILLVGWFFARVLQRVVTNFLHVAGVEKLGDQMGISSLLGKESLASLVGLIVYILVLIPVLIASLNALELQAITGPVTVLLNGVFGATPKIFAAALLVLVSYLVARVVARMAANLLSNMGFDSLLARLGLGKEPAKGDWTLSEVVRTLVTAGITFLASIAAFELLGFETMAELASQFLVFAGQVIVGLLITVVGVYLANLASKTIQSSKAEQAGILAMAARIAIIVLAVAMALRQLGLASDIINLSFGLLLGGLVVGAALAFGLGGREIAGRKLEEWLKNRKLRKL